MNSKLVIAICVSDASYDSFFVEHCSNHLKSQALTDRFTG